MHTPLTIISGENVVI